MRAPKCVCSPFPGTLLVAVALLAGGGCSGGQSASVSEANASFSADEMAEMRKSAKSVGELREMMRVKLAQRAGAAVTTKTSGAKKKPN
jgi:hypothetical protein